MGTSSIAWADGAPNEDRGIYYPVYTAQAGAITRYIAVSNYVVGVWTHHIERRTVPHLEPARDCAGCQALQGKRWRGYLGVWEPEFCRLGVLVITEDACRNCDVLKQDPPIDLRGHAVRAWRIGMHKQAPMRIEFDFARLPELNIPDAFNVPKALMRMWGMQAARDRGEPG